MDISEGGAGAKSEISAFPAMKAVEESRGCDWRKQSPRKEVCRAGKGGPLLRVDPQVFRAKIVDVVRKPLWA